jgi:hypothetical protein
MSEALAGVSAPGSVLSGLWGPWVCGGCGGMGPPL